MFYRLRLWVMLASLLLSVYLLLPTFMGLRQKRAEYTKAGTLAPWYYNYLPEAELNYGLDLRGGLYLELDVDIEEALLQRATMLSSDIKQYIIEKDFKEATIERTQGTDIRVMAPAKITKELQNKVIDFYGVNTFQISTSKNEALYAVTGDFEMARQAVLQVLGQDGFKGSVLKVNDGKILSVTASADKSLSDIESLLTSLSPATLNPVADDVFYLSLTDEFLTNIRKEIVEQASNSVRNRIDRFGVAESGVSSQGGNRLVVELPGISDPEDVINIIKKTGKLEFRLVNEEKSSRELQSLVARAQSELKIVKSYERESLKKINDQLKNDLPAGSEIAFEIERDAKGQVKKTIPYLLLSKVELTGDMLEKAQVQVEDGMPRVTMSFDKAGAKLFGDMTSQNIGKQLAIVLDGVVMSAPAIRSAIYGGNAQIELGFGDYDQIMEEAKQLVLVLREGALPATMSVASKNLIGPALGQESIDAGLRALMWASLAVVAFMIIYYRVGGIIANIALAVNVVLIFALMALFGASLSLPGIAGIVLTIGMAVDANVIIFERMREEKYLGKPLREVVASGYDNALSAILDGNITTFISGLVLFQFGTGPIKGFAVTLMIGIITTMITAVYFTRGMYGYLVDGARVKNFSV